MRRCSICGEDIASHTREPLSLLTLKAIHSMSRNPADGRRLTREASRRCRLVIDREEDGMPVFRVPRDRENPLDLAA